MSCRPVLTKRRRRTFRQVETRAVRGYRPTPILFNEGDPCDREKSSNNLLSAIGEVFPSST